jgi:hypothetical protein
VWAGLSVNLWGFVEEKNGLFHLGRREVLLRKPEFIQITSKYSVFWADSGCGGKHVRLKSPWCFATLYDGTVFTAGGTSNVRKLRL